MKILNQFIPALLFASGLVLPAAGQTDEKTVGLLRGRLEADVKTLADPSMEGRGPGSRGLEASANFIIERFQSSGLTPGGDETGWTQSFTPPTQPSGRPYEVAPAAGKGWEGVVLRNVIGLIPGSGGPDAPCIVIGAHYDHLGLSASGEACPGADDNASGVAVLCELAMGLKSEGPFPNTIALVAFSGEEEGDLGSRYYMEHPACSVKKTMAMINLDTVGRMEGKKLYIFGATTAQEFAEMLKGINMSSNLDLVEPASAPFASDQVPFYEQGIPVLHFFTGPNSDYHRPGDVASKINADGLVHILEFVDQAAVYLAGRETMLTFVAPGKNMTPAPMAASGSPRRVSLGAIPDFARESGGVLLSGVVPGSPAEGAGLQKGDILISLGGDSVDNLADLSAALKSHQPGDTVDVVAHRGSEEIHRVVRLMEKK
jgi:aminopeptidase N